MNEYRELLAKALEALEVARELPHGPARSLAMKLAGKLRVAADQKLTAPEGHG